MRDFAVLGIQPSEAKPHQWWSRSSDEAEDSNKVIASI